MLLLAIPDSEILCAGVSLDKRCLLKQQCTSTSLPGIMSVIFVMMNNGYFLQRFVAEVE